jgi:hypothetical protein
MVIFNEEIDKKIDMISVGKIIIIILLLLIVLVICICNRFHMGIQQKNNKLLNKAK